MAGRSHPGAPPARPRLSVTAPALIASVLFAAAALAFTLVRGPSAPSSLQGRVQQVASTLRCPVCEGVSVADSPTELARQMRATIAADLRKGMTPGQIRQTFVRAYGPFILMAPPARGIGLVVWMVPAVLLAAGLALAGIALRRWTRESRLGGGPASVPDASMSASDRALLERALAAPDGEGDGA